MKLLDTIVNMSINDYQRLVDIKECLEERRDTLEMQEPMGDSEFFYEKWEEKYDAFCSIYDDMESIVEELEEYLDEDDEVNLKQLTQNEIYDYNLTLEEIASNLDDYQEEYGGLKRLKI